jgi:hypothetical protein
MQSLITALELNVFHSELCKIPQQQLNPHISEFQVHISKLNVSVNALSHQMQNHSVFVEISFY